MRLDQLREHHREELLAGHLHLLLPRLGPLARHAVPRLAEAVLAPLVILFTVGSLWGLYAAVATGLVFCYTVIAVRSWRGRAVPVLLALSALSLTVRAAVLLSTGSLWLYYAGPMVMSCAVAIAFVVSALRHTPITRRVACDFVPGMDIAAQHPDLARAFRHMAFVWAAASVLQATVTATLLATLPDWSAVTWRAMLMPVVSGVALGTSLTMFALAWHRGGLRPRP